MAETLTGAPADGAGDFLRGGGEMGALMRAHDWSTSPLGDPSTWPHSLRSVVSLMINAGHPMFVAWGPQLAFLYNDAYRPIFGARHPWALGRPFDEAWAEIWDDVGPLARRAMAGESVFLENLHLVMERNGYPEDTWYTFSYSPVRDESGGIGGMFCACIETTKQVQAERLAALQAVLDGALHGLEDPLDVLAAAQEALARELNAARAGYGEVDEERQSLVVLGEWADGKVASVAGTVRPLSLFGPVGEAALRAGRTVAVNDLTQDPRIADPSVRDVLPKMSIKSIILTPLLRGDAVSAVLYVHDTKPRIWTEADIGLIEYIAERTWAEVQRCRAETARREAEEALRRQLEAEGARLRELFEQAPSFMAVMRGPGHVFELANAPFLQLVGDRAVIGRGVEDVLPEISRQGFVARLDRVYQTGEPYVGRGVKLRLARADGTTGERILDLVYQPIRDAQGRVDGIFLEGIDVTERFEAGERLQIAQRAGRIGAFEWFPDTGGLEVSPEYRQLFGLPADAPVTADMLVALVLPEDRGATGPNRMHFANPLEYAEYRIRRADTGEVRWLARQGEALGEADGAKRFLGVAFDITERKRAEEALRRLNDTLEQRVADAIAERKLWADVFEATDVKICVVDRDYRFLAVNRAFADLCEQSLGGRPQPGDDMLATLAPWPDRAKEAKDYWDRAFAGEIFTAPMLFDRTPHEVKFSLIRDRDGHPLGALQIAQDISERVKNEVLLRETEDALRQAHKMEAVGQLTGGIAHDFNNLLQGIMGSLDFIQKRIAQGRYDDLERFLVGAATSATRAAALTHRLLAFSRRQPLNPQPIKANPLILSMEDMLHRTLGETIELELDLEIGLWPTRSDGNQLESALLNLVINARDAMPAGGRLTVRTGNMVLADGEASRSGLPPGDYVAIEVADTGVGMTTDVLERAFDPFFTTKPLGQGTGLGLSMIYGFTRQSSGAARIESKEGEGTVVRLLLPRFRGPALADEVKLRGEGPAHASGQTVLVVEDEPVVRELIVQGLSDLGYRLLQAIDGPTALALLQSTEPVDLLITDVGLPGLNGRQVADSARQSRPELKVLLMTGYAEGAIGHDDGFLATGMALMTKPFTHDALARMVAQMLHP